MNWKHRLALLAVVIGVGVGSVYCLAQVAHADTAPPSPTPVIGTGGLVNGSEQGSSCLAPPAMRYAPATNSNPYAWAEPDWPGFAAVTTPAPSAPGCSR